MKKKWIALVLAGAMVMTAFTGCGNKKSDDSATKDDSAATEESSGESTEIVNKEATIEVPEEVTKGGELKIALTSSP